MLRELIKKRVQCLNTCIPNIKDDECGELSLCDYSQELIILYLLNDEKFVEILDKYSSEIEDGELADFLCECVKNGFPLFAAKCVVIYLFCDEVYDTRVDVSLPACIQGIAKIDNSVHNEELLVDDTEEYCTEPESNIESYYFDINYVTSEKVGNETEQSILFDSNLIDTEQFALDFLNQINDCQFENSQRTIKVTLTNINSFPRLNIYSFDRDNISVCFKRNVLAITGDAVSVEDCFLILKSTLGAVYDLIDSANILQKIKSKVAAFDDKFRQISIKRLPLSSLTLSRCDNSKLLRVEDISNVNVQELGKDTLIELLSVIENIDFSMPAELVAKMMRKLKPAQAEVIKKRYFGDKILTLEEIGKLHNVTRERVRQLEKKSIDIFNSPKNQLLRGKIISQMQLLSTYDNFITVEDLQKFGINKGIAIFLAKCLDDIEYEQDWNLFFFNIGLLRRFERVLTEIPTEFTVNELNFYAEYIADTLDNSLCVSEICYLLEKRYHKYGDFYVTGRLNQKTVLSYIMTQYFPNGIDLYDDDSLNLVRVKAREHFDGFELSDNNRAISGRLQDFCTPIGRGIWKFDITRPVVYGELLEQIIGYLKNYSSPVVPVSAVFAAFKDRLLDLNITNKYHLQGQLKRVLPAVFKTNRDYIYSGSVESFYNIVEEYIKQSNAPVTRKDILKQFPGISDIVIQQVAASTKVVNMFGYYVHLDNLHITDEEATLFKSLVDECIVDNSIYHGKTIFQKIKSDMSGLFSRIGVEHYLQCYYLLRELYPNDYSYSRPFIARKGVVIVNGEAQVLQRLQGMQEIKISVIREIAKEVGTIVDRYIEFADSNNDLILIKDRETFISADYLELDEMMFVDLDSILSQYLNDENYKSLSLFFDYWKLPKLKTRWTDWLLYSIINLYSKKFKTAVSSNYISEAIPIVVRNDFDVSCISESDISEMEKIDVDYLSDDDDLIDELDIEDFE